MSRTHKDVVNGWLNGRSVNGHHMTTDGRKLWSYAMLIGKTLEDGTKQLLDVRGVHAYSVTTSQHVSLAARPTVEVVAPIHTRRGYSGWRDFQLVDTIEATRYDARVWKTYKGAENALKRLDNPLLFVGGTPYVGGYYLTYFQHIAKNGHIVTADEYHNQ